MYMYIYIYICMYIYIYICTYTDSPVTVNRICIYMYIYRLTCDGQSSCSRADMLHYTSNLIVA